MNKHLGEGLLLDFFASELRLRGNEEVVQPHEHAGDIFCWNGEVSAIIFFWYALLSIYFPAFKIFEGMDVGRLH
jgi:hypothetical protein